ncbi:NAD(P)H-dependent flavin oxidoreductase [Chitinivibrio alkaliphilus]|uniref:2-nitropropane dioxygenase npd n=1 Tax=Chitinivibrio alkaliphilus ACht1 TaxID=1313304 RepID=U7D4X6_9BACT|nr:nitronate monooxygenase family protein [Chitinivibrio alkaliphilus]ERP31569.1 2-nitropropane dioxygenase npd [Chitinivibrio alkaliphilus ACht1]
MKAMHIGDLTVPVPIVQGGMGVGISLSGLAAAVANNGGVGVISSAGLGLIYKDASKNFLQASIDGLRAELRKARKHTKGAIGVNIMVALSNFDDMVRTSIEEKADVIFSGAGLPLDLPKFLTSDSVTKLVPIVSSAKGLRVICRKWKSKFNYLPDAVVVEGPNAGGHLGFKPEQLDDANYSLEELVEAVVRERDLCTEKYGVRFPVIAGGGLFTREDVRDILSHGADGVQIGSRFVTTTECDAHEDFKQQYIQAEEKDVMVIQSPVGMPGRALKNRFVEEVEAGARKPTGCPVKCIKTCDISNTPYCIISALYNAYRGKLDRGYAFCGSKAYMADRISSVAEVMDDLKHAFE